MTSIDQELRAKIREQVLMEQRFQRRQSPSRIPVSDKFLTERAEFVREWREMCERGERLNYLEWTNEYSGSHLVGTTHVEVDGPMEYDETEQEWRSRVGEEVARRFRRERERILEEGRPRW